MATIFAHSSDSLDMYETAIASLLSPSISTISISEVSLTFIGGFSDSLKGVEFSVSEDEGTSGIITSIEEHHNGEFIFSITELYLPLKDLMGWFNEGYYDKFFETVLDGSDLVTGSTNWDRISTFNGDDRILAGAGDDDVDSGAGNDFVDAGAGDDTVYGGQGNDHLDGGTGNDRLDGGVGNDIYVADNTQDLIVEAAGGGTDQVLVTAETFAMAENLEQLAYIGSGRVVAYGNVLDNSMAGGGKTDFLSGFDGNDLLNGWAGDDVIYGGNGDDTIIGGSGVDTLYGGEGIDTLVLTGAMSDYTVAKAGDAWLVTGGSTDTVSGFEKVLIGSQALAFDAFVTQAFDGLRYIASYPDLIKAFGADPAAGKAHYLDDGQRQGRSLGLFDPLVYAASNPDVFKAFGEDRQALTRHYIENGFSEGRSAASFDPIIYAASNLDVAHAFGYDPEALTLHYLEEGLRQGRDAHSFDPLRYAASNPDVAKAFGTDSAALTRHWIDSGSVEGRSTTSFDPRQYAAANPDVAQAFGTDLTSITLHYIQEGIAQGRPTSGFDAVAYLLSYDDLGAAHLGATGAFNHWLSDGISQKRLGDALFGREQASHALKAEGTTAASFERQGDHDWFVISANAGQHVKSDVRASGSATIELHRLDGSLMASSINGTLDVVADATASYYFSAYGNGATSGAYSIDLHIM